MATHDYVIANQSGAAFRTDLNNALAAIVSNNSNASEPATKYAYQWWADTSAGILKIRNSSNNGWINVRELDGTTLLASGSVSEPGLAFSGDTNTGIYRSGADTLNVTAGGLERLKLGAETCFNDDGYDVNFRIETDNNANMFFVDGGNNRIGIGTASPDTLLHLSGADTAILRLENTDTSLTTNQIIGGVQFEKQDASGAGAGVVGGLRMRSGVDGITTYLSLATSNSSGNDVEHFRLEDDGDLRLSSSDAATNYGFFDGWSGSTGQMQIGSDHGTTGSGTNMADIIFKTRGGEKVRVQHTGGISFNGDTATANALDDYEEGTWTPFVGTQGGTDYTLGTTYNCYTKIGNLVYAYFKYQFTAEGNGTISIFNLPITADSNVDLVGQGYVTQSSNRRSLQFRKYTTTLLLAAVDDGTQYLQYWSSRSNWAPTNTFVCHIVYKAA